MSFPGCPALSSGPACFAGRIGLIGVRWSAKRDRLNLQESQLVAGTGKKILTNGLMKNGGQTGREKFRGQTPFAARVGVNQSSARRGRGLTPNFSLPV